MASKSDPTVATTVRVLREQEEALRSLPIGISKSALVRVLLQLYLEGKIPQAHSMVLAEADRATRLQVNSRFGSEQS